MRRRNLRVFKKKKKENENRKIERFYRETILVKRKLYTHAGWKWAVNRWPKEKKRISWMAGNGIESKLEDRGPHKQGTERKKERKDKGWRREVQKGRRMKRYWPSEQRGRKMKKSERSSHSRSLWLSPPVPPDLPPFPRRICFHAASLIARIARLKGMPITGTSIPWFFRIGGDLGGTVSAISETPFSRGRGGGGGKRVWRKLDLLSPRTFSISERKTDVFQLLISLPLPPRGISILIFFCSLSLLPPRTFRSVSRINLHSFEEQAWILFTSRQIFAATLYERNVFGAANHPFVSRHQTERKTLGRHPSPTSSPSRGREGPGNVATN